MKIFISRTFAWWEIGLIKLCLLSLGALAGMYWYDYLAGYVWVLWVIFVVTATYFVVRFMREQ